MRCVHCLKEIEQHTKDHVFPKSWYPDTTPLDVQRWTVPSCKICNEKLGRVEKRVFVKLAMCVDPQKVEASGMSAKALRSIGIGANAPGGEMARRQALKRRIFSMLRPLGFFKRGGLLPGLGPHKGTPAGEQIAITIPAADLMTVSE